jgi:hypothetical protein
MAIADFAAGVQGVRAAMLERAIKEAEQQEKIRQFEAELALNQNRLGEDARQFDTTASIQRNRLGEDQRQFDAEAPDREERKLYLGTQRRHLEETPLRMEAERQATEAQAAQQHKYRLGEIGAQGANQASRANKSWVLRGGQPTFVTDDEVMPGDTPYRAPQSTTETAQDRQRSARIDAARGFLGKLNELRGKINVHMGPKAGLTGMVRQGAAAIGMDPDVAEYERERSAAGRALAVAIMGAQNLSDSDAKAWADMLPGARVDEQTAQRLMTQVGTMLESMAGDMKVPGAPSAQGAAPPAGADNDPLGLRR